MSQRASVPVDLDDILRFVFPGHIQHPLALPRLYAFAYYGPLDANLELRSGYKRQHVLKDYELESICVQFDKEDVINIYMEKTDGSQCALLTSEQQNSVVNQADARFKVAKGKAMMPALTKDDVKKLLKDLPKDEDGMLNFHDVQDAVLKYRAQRTKDFKLVYPPLAKPVETATFSSTGMSSGTMMGGSMSASMGMGMSMTQKKHHKIKKDIESVAPKTMFVHDVGLSNAEIVEQTTKNLSKLAFKITSVGGDQTGARSNVLLLREVPPKCKDPYAPRGKGKKPLIPRWDDTSNMKRVGMGSMVEATPSATTWIRKNTIY